MNEQDNIDAQDATDDRNVVDGGVGVGDAEEQGIDTQSPSMVFENDPKSVKKRLGMQQKRHEREMRMLNQRIAEMQEMMSSQGQQQNSFDSPGQPSPANMSEEQRIEYAVKRALGMQEEQQQKARQAEERAHLMKQYDKLNKDFDKASEMYDDFDDVVRGDDVPFTSTMRDLFLTLPNASEVAYNLGKNRSELERIAKLRPLEQAREINSLALSLYSGGGQKSPGSQPNTLGTIKANPVGGSRANTNRSASDIRAQMKAGTWK